MKVVLLRDKKAGHAHQAEGIALALATLGDTEVVRLDARPCRLGHNRILAAIVRHWPADPAAWLSRIYGIDAAAVGRPGVIVASGRPTIAAGILLSRITGAPFVYAGRITGYPLDDVALQLVASPRHAHDPKATFAPIPTRVDRTALPAAKPLSDPADIRGARVALLVGGDASGYRYAAGDWAGLVTLVETAATGLGVRWVATTSRRSPPAVGDALAALAARGAVETFVDWRTAGAGSADALFAADALVVTEDSLSMIAEAVATGRPVAALKPARVDAGFPTEVVAAVAARGALAVLPMATTRADDLARALADVRPERDDPREALARILARAL